MYRPSMGLGATVVDQPDKYFLDLLGGRAPEVALAIEDEVAGPEGGVLLMLGPAGGGALVPMAASPTVRLDYARLPVTVLLPDGRSVTVHFDLLTHSSKKQRALTEC